MRLVQVCPYNIDRAGGVQRHIVSMTNELRRRGHDVLIVAPGPAPADPTPQVHYIGRQRELGFSKTRFEVSLAGGAELRELTRVLTERDVDLLHFHTMWTPLMPLQLFRRRRSAAVASFHDTPPDGLSGKLLRQVFRVLSRLLLDRLDGAIANSSAPAGHLWPSARGARPVIIPPAVDLAPHFAVAGAPRDRAIEPFRVLFVGRLEKRKGVEILLRAWELLFRDAAPNPGRRRFKLIVAGRGELANNVERAQRRFDPQAIEFVEAPDDPTVIKLMGEADLLVAPSPFGESFGIVLVEALASGTPVVAAANLGYSTVLTGPGRDCLVPPGDSGALAATIARLANDPAKCNDLAHWGRAHVKQFDVRHRIGEIEDVYAAAIERHRLRH